MDLTEFLRECDPEIEGLTNRIEGILAERKNAKALGRRFIRNKIVSLLDDIHVESFVKEKGRKFSIWFKNTFGNRKGRMRR